jgi:hypothetical protein
MLSVSLSEGCLRHSVAQDHLKITNDSGHLALTNFFVESHGHVQYSLTLLLLNSS